MKFFSFDFLYLPAGEKGLSICVMEKWKYFSGRIKDVKKSCPVYRFRIILTHLNREIHLFKKPQPVELFFNAELSFSIILCFRSSLDFPDPNHHPRFRFRSWWYQ
jgi:hypothetical protein